MNFGSPYKFFCYYNSEKRIFSKCYKINSNRQLKSKLTNILYSYYQSVHRPTIRFIALRLFLMSKMKFMVLFID